MTSDLVLAALRLFFGGVLLLAGGLKIWNTGELQRSIERYRLLPSSGSWVAARLLPPVEIVVGALVVFGVWSVSAAAVAAGLFFLFLVAGISAIGRGMSVRCSCFGLLYTEFIGWRTMMRDGLLASVAVVSAWLGPDAFTIWNSSPASGSETVGAGVATVVTSTALVFGWWAERAPLRLARAPIRPLTGTAVDVTSH